jgi:hypothetical protein
VAQTQPKEREQGSQAQGSQQRGLSRRYSDPWGYSLMPSDLFSMNPFSIMRRMQDEMDRVFGSAFGGGRGGLPIQRSSQQGGSAQKLGSPGGPGTSGAGASTAGTSIGTTSSQPGGGR